MKFLNLAFLACISFLTIACDGSDLSSSNINNSVTSSHAVGGESSTMAECKDRLDKTASKYNVQYTVKLDDPDFFSGRIIKDGRETDLTVFCRQKGDIFQGTFEVPN